MPPQGASTPEPPLTHPFGSPARPPKSAEPESSEPAQDTPAGPPSPGPYQVPPTASPFGPPPGAPPQDQPPGPNQGPSTGAPLGPPPGVSFGPPPGPYQGPPAGSPFGPPPGAPPQDQAPGPNQGPPAGSPFGPPPGAPPQDQPPGPNQGPPAGSPFGPPPDSPFGASQGPPPGMPFGPPQGQPGPPFGLPAGQMPPSGQMPPPGQFPPGQFPPGQVPPPGAYGAGVGYAEPGTGNPAVPPLPPMPQENWHDGSTPTAEEFARRRQAKPADPVASQGLRGALAKSTMGLVSVGPGKRELEYRQEVEMVRRNFGGLRQVTVVNPKGGAGKTVAVLLLAMTFGQKRGGYVLAWDNNETQGTLGMRAQQDFHNRTVRDLLHNLRDFQGAQGRIGDLSQYVRAQGEGMFDVLASDESATAGEMLTADAFGELRDVVSRFYKLIFVDTGNNVRAENWQAAIDATDQLVVTMSARNDSAETASRMLDHLEQHGRQRLVRQAVTVVSMPPSKRYVDVPAITRHFAARTRTVMIVPYERFIDSGEPIRYAGLSAASRDAWLKVAAAVSEGL
ncbi:chromosome partitioning protein [Dactylosporangium matsuzakiense]|uniref:chromosome partitioning protein n=1 Tax=Dactylosporangium matsuzakiense TaxID=53360 RepID=UPI0021C4A8E7|nr:chromosome partitioning protein [Dactylosporangium matsuzakiense]